MERKSRLFGACTIVLALAIGLNLGERWQIGVQAEGTHMGSTDWFFNPGAQLQFRLNPHWAFQVGYVSYSREISTDELFNRTDYEAPFGGVSYVW